MAKRVKPSKVPVSLAFAEKRYKDGLDDGCRMLFACMAMTLRDTDRFNNEELGELWNRTKDRLKMIADRKASLKEYEEVLDKEYGVTWVAED